MVQAPRFELVATRPGPRLHGPAPGMLPFDLDRARNGAMALLRPGPDAVSRRQAWLLGEAAPLSIALMHNGRAKADRIRIGTPALPG